MIISISKLYTLAVYLIQKLQFHKIVDVEIVNFHMITLRQICRK